MLTPPTTVDPGMTPQAMHSFAVASWIVFAVLVVLFRRWIRLVWRLVFGRPRSYRRRWLSGLIAPLRMTPEYHQYITSAAWRRKCDRYYRRNGRRCHFPGCRARSAAVHHLTYRRLGHEGRHELVGLCAQHHSEIHGLFEVHVGWEDPAAFGGQLRFLNTRQHMVPPPGLSSPAAADHDDTGGRHGRAERIR